MSRRRITPIPVNTSALTSVALRKVIKNQGNILRVAKRTKTNKNRMSTIIKNMMLNAYVNALARQRPNATAYNIRSAMLRGKNMRGANLRKRLFGNRNKQQ